MSLIKKLKKTVAKVNEKVLPKSVQKVAAKATDLAFNINPVTSTAQFYDEQKGGTFAEKRAALRSKHFREFLPLSKTTRMSNEADKLLASSDPTDQQRGAELRAQVDRKTLRHGQAGAAVGSLFVGGAAGGAVKAAAAATRINPTPEEATGNPVDTWPDPNAVPDVQQQMYRRRPAAAPIAQQRTNSVSAANGGGVLTKVVNVLWQILVPRRS